MGRLHWAKHAEKPTPLLDYPLPGEPDVRVIVRERPGAALAERFVATVRFVHPPQKGQYVVAYAYGGTAAAAEVRVLDAYYGKAQARR